MGSLAPLLAKERDLHAHLPEAVRPAADGVARSTRKGWEFRCHLGGEKGSVPKAERQRVACGGGLMNCEHCGGGWVVWREEVDGEVRYPRIPCSRCTEGLAVAGIGSRYWDA